MSQNKNRYKNSDNMKDTEQKINDIIPESEDEIDEADRILQELDEMEERKTQDISAKVRDLIKNDKEALRDYHAKAEENISNEDIPVAGKQDDKAINQEIDSDEIDYLSDEEIVQNNREETNSQKQNTKYAKRKNKKHRNNTKNNNQSAEIDTKIIETTKVSGEEESEEEDFLATLDKRTEQIMNEGLRKKQPSRLKSKENFNQDSHIFVSTIRNLAMSGIKNMVVMISVIALLMVLIAAMILDRNNTGEEKISGSFLEMDTTKIVSLINDYYAALGNNDMNKAREYLENDSEISDDVLLEKIEEARVYKEYIADSFTIISCNIQPGLEENEYIAYFKFELKIKKVETPAVGMFSSYLINVSKDEKNPQYEIGNVNASSERNKYIAKMSHCSNVTELFEQTNKELAEACEKDENLKNVVEALKNIGKANSETTTTGDKGSTEDSGDTTEAMTE